MSRLSPFGVCVIGGLLTTLAIGQTSSPPSLPTVRGQKALATVNGAPVTLDEFYEQLASLHRSVEAPGEKIHKQHPWELLDRLINIRLILQEARNIGLDDLPQVKDDVAARRIDIMRSLLYEVPLKGITAGDKVRIEELYRRDAKEVKLTSVLLEKEDDARALETRLKAGGDFGQLIDEIVGKGKGKKEVGDQYLKAAELIPEIRTATDAMTVGGVSPPVRIGAGFTIMRLDSVRYPDDPAARTRAEKQALQEKKSAALKAYVDRLRTENSKVDRKLLDGLDYESKEPGFERLAKDGRAVAEVKGEKPVTVMELTEAIRSKFFHGIDRAVKEKRINARKSEVLDELLTKRVLAKEARRLKIDQSAEYKRRVADYEDGVLFGTFVQRVIDPTIKVQDAELQGYLKDHGSEFASPAMVRLDGLAFGDRKTAEAALSKLQKGADFEWMRSNAQGQADPDENDFLQSRGTLIITTSLPADVQKAISGARSGDFRFYAETKGPYYVLCTREVVPPKPQPLNEVKDEITKRIVDQKRQDAVKEWAGKLRKAYEVKTFVTPDTLDQVLGLGSKPKA